MELNDEEEKDLHIPSEEEIKKRIEELKTRKDKYLGMQDEMAKTEGLSNCQQLSRLSRGRGY